MKTVLMLSLLSVVGVQSQTRWEIDKAHTNVMFTVTHLVVSEVTGHFKSFDGSFTYTKPDFSDAKGELAVDVNSISTDIDKRDAHLKSEDFFYAEKYPQLTFVSQSFKKVGDNTYKITGDLTIRGVTKTVELDGLYRGEVTDPYGNVKSAWKLTGTINRHDFGLKWNALIETGGAVVSADVNLTVNVQLVKKS